MLFMNSSTSGKIDFKHIYSKIRPLSEPGKSALHNFQPFKTGKEKELNLVFDKIDILVEFAGTPEGDELEHLLLGFREVSIFKESGDSWGKVELGHLVRIFKSLKGVIKWITSNIKKGLWDFDFNPDIILNNLSSHLTTTGLTIVDSNGGLLEIRKRVSDLQAEFDIKEDEDLLIISKLLGVEKGRLRGYITVDSSEYDKIEILNSIKQMVEVEKTPLFRKYRFFPGKLSETFEKEILSLRKKAISIEEKIEKDLIHKIQGGLSGIGIAFLLVGDLDLNYAKAKLSIELNGVRPYLKTEGFPRMVSGKNPIISKFCEKLSVDLQPISIDFTKRIVSVVGSNMGGKTAFLRTIGLFQAMVQYGLWIPAKRFETSLFSTLAWCGLSEGRSQDGLSSFGEEIVDLAKALDGKKPLFLLVDEFARSTDIEEGKALAVSLIHFLNKRKDGFSIFAGHLREVGNLRDVQSLETGGLDQRKIEDWDKKEDPLSQLTGAMDYTVYPSSSISKSDTLLVAKMFGLPDALLEEAKNILFCTEEN
jgi:DNA mismatch repair ATPase MutS